MVVGRQWVLYDFVGDRAGQNRRLSIAGSCVKFDILGKKRKIILLGLVRRDMIRNIGVMPPKVMPEKSFENLNKIANGLWKSCGPLLAEGSERTEKSSSFNKADCVKFAMVTQ